MKLNVLINRQHNVVTRNRRDDCLIAASDCATVLVTVFEAEIDVLQANELFPVEAPDAILVTVIVVLPAVVRPVAVNVPVPAVETVIVAD